MTYKNGLFVVGPESVGAHPGPACYRKGGALAITDANAVLGRLIPSQFPSIFGVNADEPLDVQASFDKFAILTEEINASRPGLKPYTLEEVAAGFIKVANEGMSRPMRSVSGFPTGRLITDHRTKRVCNQCPRSLLFRRSWRPACCCHRCWSRHRDCDCASFLLNPFCLRYSLCRQWVHFLHRRLTSVSAESSAPFSAVLAKDPSANQSVFKSVKDRIVVLQAQTAAQLLDQDVQERDAVFEATLGCHYDGSDTVLQIPFSASAREDFIAAHLQETSFSMPRNVVISSLRIRGIGKSFNITPADFVDELENARNVVSKPMAQAFSTTEGYFETPNGGRRIQAPVYKLDEMPAGCEVRGPAVIVDNTQTIVVEPTTTALVLSQHVIMTVTPEKATLPKDEEVLVADPIMMAVFGNRFMR